MSTLLWIALSLYALSFIILFFFVKNGESKEDKPSSLPTIILTAAMLALIVAASLIVFMLIPMGAMFIAKRFFDFNTDINSIVFIGGIVVLYAITFDHLLHLIVQRVMKHSHVHHLFFNVLRFFIFMGITSFVSVSTRASIWISLVLTVLFIVIDLGSQLFTKKEQPHA